ncbi:MAG: hypothetical protein LBU58_00335 [Clostridiales bacterium]|jgi:hypothetical protein|nr:hypothetical protein [Clostridiales bacterium]
MSEVVAAPVAGTVSASVGMTDAEVHAILLAIIGEQYAAAEPVTPTAQEDTAAFDPAIVAPAATATATPPASTPYPVAPTSPVLSPTASPAAAAVFPVASTSPIISPAMTFPVLPPVASPAASTPPIISPAMTFPVVSPAAASNATSGTTSAASTAASTAAESTGDPSAAISVTAPIGAAEPGDVSATDTPEAAAPQILIEVTNPSADETVYKNTYSICGVRNDDIDPSETLVLYLTRYNAATQTYELFADIVGDARWQVGSNGVFTKSVLLDEGDNAFAIAACKVSVADAVKSGQRALTGADIQVARFTIHYRSQSIADKISEKLKELAIANILKEIETGR